MALARSSTVFSADSSSVWALTRATSLSQACSSAASSCCFACANCSLACATSSAFAALSGALAASCVAISSKCFWMLSRRSVTRPLTESRTCMSKPCRSSGFLSSTEGAEACNAGSAPKAVTCFISLSHSFLASLALPFASLPCSISTLSMPSMMSVYLVCSLMCWSRRLFKDTPSLSMAAWACSQSARRPLACCSSSAFLAATSFASVTTLVADAICAFSDSISASSELADFLASSTLSWSLPAMSCKASKMKPQV
mmetsp:Transcript_91469/g.217989  ORF Transcript_91469/g.217989 Transcript_91469/m.217989 type:complete len:257 (+) Transcript_91469:253-1023(+)